MRPLERAEAIDYWDDQRIRPGAVWREQIVLALETCDIAILLVSADFLASDFIASVELPGLLARGRARGLTILPILLRPCSLDHTPLVGFQTVNPPGRELSVLPEHERERVWVRVVEHLRSALSGGDRASPAAAPGRAWTLPFERNPFFTGREAELRLLADHLRRTNRVALCGLGGIGKTQVAVEYAYVHRSDYAAVFWANARSSLELAASFAEIARSLALPEWQDPDHSRAIAATRQWLEKNASWLLVLDAADQIDAFRAFLPRTRSGHVLITTRSPAGQARGAAAIELEPMSPDEAVAFLQRRVRREDGDPDPGEHKSAAELAEELGYLPLAMEQAGAYITANQARFRDYLRGYQRRRLAVLPAPIAGDYPESVATTWALNFREVEQVPAAADLLRVSAFMSPDHVPLELLARGAKHLGPAVIAALADIDQDPLLLDEALEPLYRYSLVSRDIANRTYSIHRVMQAVLLNGMDVDAQRLWAERAVRAVHATFPIPDHDNWDACKRLIAHAQACASHIERFGFDFAEAGKLLHNAAEYLRRRAQLAEAARLQFQVVVLRERTLGSAHSAVADALRQLAKIHRDQGLYDEAETAMRRALAITEAAFDPEHPRVASVLNSLGALMRQVRRIDDAEQLIRRSLAIHTRVLGEDHPDVAPSLTNLALVLVDQGDLDGAGSMALRAQQIEERALGKDHPNLAASTTVVADILRRQGRWPEAEVHARRAHALDVAAFGREHPNVAYSLCAVAEILAGQGRYDEALPLYEQALRNREQGLGAEHPLMADTLECYARLLDRMGRTAEAEAARLRAADSGGADP